MDKCNEGEVLQLIQGYFRGKKTAVKRLIFEGSTKSRSQMLANNR